jgi:dedicator of cytokinesis protein 9/10/11
MFHSNLQSYIKISLFSDTDLSPGEDFMNNHFLAGILLKHVHLSLNEAPQKRKQALTTLRELLMKHELDDRYKGKASHGRIASLYVPWLPIVVGMVFNMNTNWNLL